MVGQIFYVTRRHSTRAARCSVEAKSTLGVGVVNRYTRDLLERAVGKDAVQVQRNHDWTLQARRLRVSASI